MWRRHRFRSSACSARAGCWSGARSAWSSRSLRDLASSWPGGQEPTLWSVQRRRQRQGSRVRNESRSSAASCPTRRGSISSTPPTARSSTSARRARSASAIGSHFSGGELAPHLARRPDRVHGHRDRGRGAAGRAELHQAPPAALQHPPARRQVLPLRLRQPRRGLPAGLLHPREAPLRPRLLRPLLQCQAGARDPRPARQAVPVPHLRGKGARAPLRQSLPRLLHQALRGALRRLRQRRRSTGTTSTRSSTSSPAATARSRPTSRRRWRRRRPSASSSAPPCTATG